MSELCISLLSFNQTSSFHNATTTWSDQAVFPGATSIFMLAHYTAMLIIMIVVLQWSNLLCARASLAYPMSSVLELLIFEACKCIKYIIAFLHTLRTGRALFEGAIELFFYLLEIWKQACCVCIKIILDWLVCECHLGIYCFWDWGGLKI